MKQETKGAAAEAAEAAPQDGIWVGVATEVDLPHVPEILRATELAAVARGTGIAHRTPEALREKILDGRAIIARDGTAFAGFCYVEPWDGGAFVTNSGLIVRPEYRGHGLAWRVKRAAFQLCRTRWPEAKIIGLTSGAAVMRINTALGYVPVTFDAMPRDPAFWKGCEQCINYDVLQRNDRRRCICTAMLYDPDEPGPHARAEIQKGK